MKRVDDNQRQVVKQLRQIGASVAITSMIGKGHPDILVGYRSKNYIIEIKDGSKPPSQRKLTPDEIAFHKSWRGQIAVCNSFDEIMKVITQ